MMIDHFIDLKHQVGETQVIGGNGSLTFGTKDSSATKSEAENAEPENNQVYICKYAL